MNFIDNIISDFFNCCNLPVIAVDINFNELCSVGYNPVLRQIYNNCNVHRDIPHDSNNLLSLNYSYAKDINFIVVPISRFNRYRGYFIIGPIKCEKTGNEYIPYKPKSCLEFFSSIILNIADHNFSKGMSNLKFNVHVKKAIQYIHEHYTQCINLDDLCIDLSVNKSYFCKVFKKETGFTFSNFLNNYRVEKSKNLLKNTNLSLLDIAVSVGFNTQNYYSIAFKKFTDKTPLKYRNSISM
ncbi:helix-turn-helix domain-containing protein [Vallitalea guaymasensis]|uniref:helix-turn-helix domain-containing protein n=1 Tax=Vallitalea guaymasensis TaxID=1185412 RepID=UPI00272BD7D9|nr:AraC family transcriptional regulator [Vallitalea guaymasensis]